MHKALHLVTFACIFDKVAHAIDVEVAHTRKRVAVIGAGIGGGSFSYYWSKLRPQDEILAFESRDYIGGRLKHTHLHGQLIELGGDAWSTAVNAYVVELAKLFGAQRMKYSVASCAVPRGNSSSVGDPIQSSMGIWQGDHIEPIIEVVRRQPLSDLRAAFDEAGFILKLKDNYHRRGEKHFFRSIEDFLSIGGLDKFTSTSSLEYFMEAGHISKELLQFALEPLTRVIYDQNLSESHAFSSLVAVTAAIGAAQFDTGNSALVEKLFDASRAVVRLNTSVTDVIRDDRTGSYVVRSCISGASCSNFEADIVIVASPIEHTNISFVPQINSRAREWRHWYVTITRAKGLNPQYFNLLNNRSFSNVLTTENSSTTIPFNVVQLEATLPDGTSLWKLFSNSNVSTTLADIFDGLSQDPRDTIVQYWPYTFPILRPVPKGTEHKYQPIELAPKLIHLNAMESVASAMEGSIIAARNAALLLSSDLVGADEVLV